MRILSMGTPISWREHAVRDTKQDFDSFADRCEIDAHFQEKQGEVWRNHAS